MRWGEVRARQLAREHPSDRTTHLASYAFQGDAEVTAALEALGYVAVRWDAEMLRPDMDDIPAVVLADGYHLRAPEEAELPAVHQMMVEGFAEHWGEYEAEDQRIEDWLEDPRFRRDLVVVAWAGDRPASVVYNILETAPDGTRRGLLDAVATHPDHRRRGLARAAIARSLRAPARRGSRRRPTSASTRTTTTGRWPCTSPAASAWPRPAPRYRKPMPGTGGPTMTTLDTRPPAAGAPVQVADAPPIPGLSFRHATPADWAAIADLVNRARRADGLDEVRSGEDLAAEYADSESFKLARDMLLAEIDGALAGYAMGYRLIRDGALVAETQGDVAPEVRRRRIGSALYLATRARLAAECADDPRPGPRELRVVRPRGRDGRPGAPRGARVRPDPLRLRDAPLPDRGPAGSPAARRASRCGPSPRTSTARSSTPTTRRSRTTGAIARPRRPTSRHASTART